MRVGDVLEAGMGPMWKRQARGVPARICVVLAAAMTVLVLLAGYALAAEQAGQGGAVTVVAAGKARTYEAYRLFSAHVGKGGKVSGASWDDCMGPAFYQGIGTFSSAQDALVAVVRGARGGDSAGYIRRLADLAEEDGESKPVKSVRSGRATHLGEGVWLLVCKESQPILLALGGDDVVVNEKGVRPGVKKEILVRGADGTGLRAKETSASSGDVVRFVLTGTLPSDYGAYRAYTYVFEDRASAAIKLDADSVRVAVVRADGSRKAVDEGFEAHVTGRVLTVEFADLKKSCPKLAFGDKLEVSYEARFRAAEAGIGFDDGNENEAVVKFTDSATKGGMGESAPDSAAVYSFAVRVVKVDEDGKRVPGAAFTLQREDGRYLSPEGRWVDDAAEATLDCDEEGTAVFRSLDAGSYRLREARVPKGFLGLAKDVTIEVRADLGQKRLGATCEGDGARLVAVDAGSGTVEVEVRNAQEAKAGVTRQGVPKTGDDAPKPLVAASALAAAMMALGLARKLASDDRILGTGETREREATRVADRTSS